MRCKGLNYSLNSAITNRLCWVPVAPLRSLKFLFTSDRLAGWYELAFLCEWVCTAMAHSDFGPPLARAWFCAGAKNVRL